MTTLDYQQSPPRKSKWARRLTVAAAVLILLTAVVPVVGITAAVVRLRADSRRFHDAYPESQLRGQSTAQILVRYGPPYTRETRPDGTTSFTYASTTTWEYCGIDFEADRVTRVYFWGK